MSHETLYETLPLTCLAIAKDGSLRSINDRGTAELGYPRDRLLGRSALAVVHPEDHEFVAGRIMAAFTGAERIEHWDIRLICGGGDTKRVRAAIRRAGDEVLHVLCMDFPPDEEDERGAPERKRELQALTAHLGVVEEHERRRIAIGLHDHIGHGLALIRLLLGQLPAHDPTSDAAKTTRAIDRLLSRTVAVTRSLTFDLSSPVLRELGIEAALESLGQEVGRRHGIRFHWRSSQPLQPCRDDLAIVLYRIVRELLENVVKHAQARSFELHLGSSADEIRIALMDDGVGFDTSTVPEGFGPRGGFGLFSIRAQLSHLGGRLELNSRAGRGTSAMVIAPHAGLAEPVS